MLKKYIRIFSSGKRNVEWPTIHEIQSVFKFEHIVLIYESYLIQEKHMILQQIYSGISYIPMPHISSWTLRNYQYMGFQIKEF